MLSKLGTSALFALTLTLASHASTGNEENETPKDKTRYFDVILLVDGSPGMANLSRKSAMVVVEAMGDQHRLGIITFGEEARILRPLDRISTVSEKMGALSTLNEATFADDAVDLAVGLNAARAELQKKGAKKANKIIVLLAGAPSEPSAEAEVTTFKASLPPLLLKEKIAVYAVVGQDADVALLQLTANLTGGKCLAAFDVETMTDALDTIVDRLQPPKEIVVTKEVPIKTVMAPVKDATPDEKLAHNKKSSGEMILVSIFAGAILLLLLGVGALQYIALKRIKVRGQSDRREVSGDKKAGKSSFAELRDLANALSNTVVDASEMLEQLNLDLEDFGVEKWRVEKEMNKRHRDLARQIFLLLDHLFVESADQPPEVSAWLVPKLERILEDAGIAKIEIAPGDAFDGLVHKHVDTEDADLPAGSVVSVKRTGYWIKHPDKTGEKVVLRQAEVVVSQKATKG